MKEKSTAPTAAPVVPAPEFTPTTAVYSRPYRHEKTGRTVGFHQAAGDQAHLFSATGVFIATAKKAEAESLFAAANPAKPETKPSQ